MRDRFTQILAPDCCMTSGRNLGTIFTTHIYSYQVVLALIWPPRATPDTAWGFLAILTSELCPQASGFNSYQVVLTPS
ncbi:MAG: hypothetical protein JWQ71_2979 [Pedosphaera sp.]|nr:hypothetical protein [Pedosphaera sp.]